jgi:hypothetical protein
MTYVYVDVNRLQRQIHVYGLDDEGNDIFDQGEFEWGVEGDAYRDYAEARRAADRFAAKKAKEHGCDWGANEE